MPQKPVFSKPPLFSCVHSFLASGMIRTDDRRIRQLYDYICTYPDHYFLWEGLFRIACLIKKDPLSEPVTDLIKNAIEEKEDGSFDGTVSEQIAIARAAFSVYEYNTDRTILNRLASWLRFIENEFDLLSLQDGFLYRSADLMEFLVRYYQVTGLKAVLRICSLLRAASFDWTSALHHFPHSVPIKNDPNSIFSVCQLEPPHMISYDDRKKVVNHAELLADGTRFSLYSGIFSGNKQDLSAGYILWQYLSKHHHALCGGITGDPFLCGKASDKTVDNCALFAWTEALSSQMIQNDCTWATDELIRIIFNGLDDYINHFKDCPEKQWVNLYKTHENNIQNPIYLLGRLTRAVACTYHHAVTITSHGIKINYLIPCRIILSFQDQPVILNMSYNNVRFISKQPFAASVDLFISSTETADISFFDKQKCVSIEQAQSDAKKTGYNIHADRCWHSDEGFIFEQKNSIKCEETNHQGLCFFIRNRLMALPIRNDFVPVAVSDPPIFLDEKLLLPVCIIKQWKITNGHLSDIPVLPLLTNDAFIVQLEPYSTTQTRISMFPRGYRNA